MDNEEKKDTRARSRLYPRYDLEDSIKFIESVSRLGGSRVSNDAVAAEVGKAVNNSTFVGRVSSSKQFGILIQESGKLSLSSLGKEIMFPKSEGDKKAAVKNAFSAPTLYKEIIEAFKGKVVPDQVTLGNRLVHDYGIEAAAKDHAARNFIRSAQYAEMFQNGILISSSDENIQVAKGSESRVEAKTTSDPFEGFFRSLQNDRSVFNDSGKGWTVTIKSMTPLNSEVRKKLIDLSELLEAINQDKAS